jgi:CubicO group peptidase (beta-lactamase class C family)
VAEPSVPSVEVAIRRRGKEWTATVDGADADVMTDGAGITLTGPDGQRFVGTLTKDRSAIDGLWLQPSSDLGYAEVATPVEILRNRRNLWASEVTVQERPFRMFLEVFEDPEGELAAVLKNPERNQIVRTRYRVEAEDGKGWALVSGSGENELRMALEKEGEGWRLHHPWFNGPLLMERSERGEIEGYLPRDPAGDDNAYTPPPDRGDGWTAVSADEAGFDPERLDALVAELSAVDPLDNRPRLIHAVLAARGGKLFFEEYFFGHDRDDRHDTRSLGKVFAPVLVGALQAQGVEIGADTRPVKAVLSGAGEPVDDPRKEEITLGHLMSFTSGLDCSEDAGSAGNEDRLWSQPEGNFWLYTARLPVLHAPGERYAYCSASINLAGAAISEAGGAPVLELFDELIAEPLDFGPYHWNLMPSGEAYLGGGPYMRPRDILKIGAVYQEGGVWNGMRIIDADWIDISTTPRIAITPETTGMTPEEFSNNSFGGEAAYEWRLDTVQAGERTYPSYEATGNGGQVLVVVPELDLVVLFMGGNYQQGGIWGRWRNRIIGGHLIPAMTDRP